MPENIHSETDAQGLVISSLSARSEAEGFVSERDLIDAKSKFPPVIREANDYQDRYFVTLTPGMVKISKKKALLSSHRRSSSGGSRAPIVKWTRKSRATMVAKLASLDYSPMFQSEELVPVMITLTYPRNWQEVVPSALVAKRHLRILQKRWERKFKSPMLAIWKMEFQRRGAPHFHIFTSTTTIDQEFKSWLSQTWAEIVGCKDPEEYRKHLRAGTGLDVAIGWKALETKLITSYFLKHNSPGNGSKEYQNQPPQEWIDQGSVGRFWGVFNLKSLAVETEITKKDAEHIARVLRKLHRSRTSPRRLNRWRVNRKTGELKPKSLVGRVKRFKGTSGFLVVRSGLDTGVALSRSLQARTSEENGKDGCQTLRNQHSTQHVYLPTNTKQPKAKSNSVSLSGEISLPRLRELATYYHQELSLSSQFAPRREPLISLMSYGLASCSLSKSLLARVLTMLKSKHGTTSSLSNQNNDLQQSSSLISRESESLKSWQVRATSLSSKTFLKISNAWKWLLGKMRRKPPSSK